MPRSLPAAVLIAGAAVIDVPFQVIQGGW